MLLAFGVVAMLELLATGTMANSEGTELTTGMHLARGIREFCIGKPLNDPDFPTNWGPEAGESVATYDDVDDLSQNTFSPPRGSNGETLTAYEGWEQTISVKNVDKDRLTVEVPNGSSPAMRVTVTVRHRGQKVYELSFFAFDASE